MTIYQDAGATTPHANPVVASAAGIFPAIYLVDGSYKTVLKTASDVTIQTIDNIVNVSDSFTPASSTGPASMDFAEDTDNGTNKVTLRGPSSLASDVVVDLPSRSGTLALTSDVINPKNMGIAATVAGGNLTIALKGADGNDPSTSNVVNVPFRNLVSSSGSPVNVPVSVPTSLVISSGSTMGFANTTAGRLWIVGFNDGVAFRLGAVNVLSGSDVMALRDGIYSSVAEGGAGTADSAQVIYTGTAVTSKAMAILGYMEWSAGLTIAGTWSIVPTTIQLFGNAIPLPGEVIQSKRTSVSQLASGNVMVPVDDTIPQITEGVEFITVAIAPAATPNLINVIAKGYYTFSADNAFVAQSIFRDATANALATSGTFLPFNGGASEILTDVSVLAATVSPTTFSVRSGAQIAGNIQINGNNGSRRYGGALNSFIEVKEIMA